MPRRIGVLAALTLAALPGIAVVTSAGSATADVCVGAGRRVHVSGCTDLAPPPAYYAPLPEDLPPPPPVNACVGVNGRWVSANTCH